MASVIKFAKGVRNHWKKSTFFALTVAYGVNYTKEYYESQELMKDYCLKAKRLGDQKIPDGVNPRSITVILNPTANRRKATKQFEKYCAPILHLAGICVDVLQTESEGHARSLVENLKKTDAIIIAGGDGTVSEVITGLFRRSEDDTRENPCPVGILPLGKTNTLGKMLFPGGDNIATVRSLADASMAIVKESTMNIDVMKIEILDDGNALETKSVINKKAQSKEKTKVETVEAVKEEKVETKETLEQTKSEEKIEATSTDSTEPVEVKLETTTEPPKIEEIKQPPKPIYAVASVEWGAFRDAYAKQDKYWYYGSLRKYATYIFNGYKKNLTWECDADINYLLPCPGCSNCYVKPQETKQRWWSRFVAKPKNIDPKSIVINEKCNEQHIKHINTSDFVLSTVNTLDTNLSQLHLNIGPKLSEYVDFVREGFKTLKGENRNFVDKLDVRQVEIIPKNIEMYEDVLYSIDKEEYEVRPIRITLLPKVLKVFCTYNIQ